MIYVFSPNGYAYDDEFEDVADCVSLCAMPDAVLNAYRRVCQRSVKRNSWRMLQKKRIQKREQSKNRIYFKIKHIQWQQVKSKITGKEATNETNTISAESSQGIGR